MKYLFFVQSNITKYLVKYHIQLNNLQEEDIIILYYRVGLEDLEDIKGQKINFLDTFYRKFVTVNKKIWQVFYLTWYSIYKVDEFIDSKVKGSYELFVPQFFWDTVQLLATNTKCKKITYIEEGDMSYATEDELVQKLSLMTTRKEELQRMVFSMGRLFRKHPSPEINKVQEAICFNSQAFPFKYIKKHVFNFRDVFNEKDYNFSYNYKDSTIFALEYVNIKEPKSEIYLKNIVNVFSILKSSDTEIIYFKPHPNYLNDQDSLNRLIDLAKVTSLNVLLINDPIEMIILRFDKVRVFCHQSSLIRYCCYAGVKPFVWGVNMVRKIDRLQNPEVYKFMHNNSDMIEFVGF
ncbi:hypothetical protein [Rufibacter roseolus]|uniref:hypothetical protein n=1 Tax=Rufibacter roseolus TaxID=2817375 RepID=UPI001B300CCD|nr:hypothetical protein [Rufibacter roseolus]